jgi:hypothetical protein
MATLSIAQRTFAGVMTVAMLTAAAPAVMADPRAGDSNPPKVSRNINGRTIGAGLLSFFIWPGIGQAVNDNRGRKIGTHAVLGLIPPFRFWSGYDALVDREGGYWEGRI